MIELDKAETGFSYVLTAYKTGGVYMHVISICGIIAIAIAAYKVYQLVTRQHTTDKYLGLIKMAGSLAFAIGILSQIVGIVQALEAIRAAADVSPQIVMKGAIMSFYAPIWGVTVFIFSMLFYFVLQEIIKAKSN